MEIECLHDLSWSIENCATSVRSGLFPQPVRGRAPGDRRLLGNGLRDPLSMLSRRLSLAAAYWLVASIRNKLLADSTYQVRIRADDVVKGSVPPVALEDLHIEPDRSTEAQALAQRAPVGRAVPLFVWIIGVMGAPLVWQFVREQVRQYWYGGVLIDARTTPVTITNDLRIPGDMVLIIEASGRSTRYRSSDLSAEIIESALKR